MYAKTAGYKYPAVLQYMKAILFVLNTPNCKIMYYHLWESSNGWLRISSTGISPLHIIMKLHPLHATVLSRSDCGYAWVSLYLLCFIALSEAIWHL